MPPANTIAPPPRAALIEITGSHDECLYSHVAMLRAAGYAVRVVLRQDVRGHQGDLGDIEGVDYLPFAAGGWRTWSDALGLRRLLRQQHIDVAVLNTAEGRRVRNFCLLPGSCVPLLGVLHNGHKLGSSLTQRCIERRVHDYLVLSDFIARQTPARRGISVAAFYPVLFPAAKPAAKRAPFCVVVPGRLEPERRDYELLLQAVSRGGLSPDIHFVLVGDASGSGAVHLRRRLRELAIESRFTCFDGFVEQATLLAEVGAADLILPLITPRTADFEQYRHSKISGAYNLAYGFGIPLLLHTAFAGIEELARASSFFEDGTLVTRLNELASSPATLAQIRGRVLAATDLTSTAQQQRYAAALARVRKRAAQTAGERAATPGNSA